MSTTSQDNVQKKIVNKKKIKLKADNLNRINKINIESAHIRQFEQLKISTNHNIICGNSKKLKIKNNTVHLIVTSPPYYNAKSYSQWDSIDEYLKDMKKIFKECFRVLKEGRKFCLNISDLPEKGTSGVKWIPLGSDLLKLCQSVGFEIVDRIFWFKTPLKGFQYGSLPYPPSPLINDSVEYIYILRKPGKSDYGYVPADFKSSSRLKRDDYVEFTKQIWSMRRVRMKDNVDGHIAPFPEELPRRCIKMYSFVGDTVLDPFGGRGTTTKMAIESKRNSILYEKNMEYIQHIKAYLDLDQTNLSNDTPTIIFEEQ